VVYPLYASFFLFLHFFLHIVIFYYILLRAVRLRKLIIAVLIKYSMLLLVIVNLITDNFNLEIMSVEGMLKLKL